MGESMIPIALSKKWKFEVLLQDCSTPIQFCNLFPCSA